MSNAEHEEQIVRYTAEEIDAMLARGEDETDWERVRNMTEEELEASIDFEEEGEFDWNTVYLGMPPVLAKRRSAKAMRRVGETEIEWDEQKRQTNIAKHGIDFEDAAGMFDGRPAVEFKSSYQLEDRRLTTALLFGRLTTVVWTQRGTTFVSSRSVDRESGRSPCTTWRLNLANTGSCSTL